MAEQTDLEYYAQNHNEEAALEYAAENAPKEAHSSSDDSDPNQNTTTTETAPPTGDPSATGDSGSSNIDAPAAALANPDTGKIGQPTTQPVTDSGLMPAIDPAAPPTGKVQ